MYCPYSIRLKIQIQKISRFVWRTCVAVHHVWNNNKSLTGFTRISVEPTVDRLYDEFVVGICVGTSVEQPYIRTHTYDITTHTHTHIVCESPKFVRIQKEKSSAKKNCVVYYFVVADCRSEWSVGRVAFVCVCVRNVYRSFSASSQISTEKMPN